MSETTGRPLPRLLLIDDEPQIRRFLGIGLRAEGFDVAEAATGRAGLVMLATGSIDAVILDLGLPDLDGQEALTELRQWSDAPVLVLSVRSDEAGKVRALDAGANDYLTKPFGMQELVARLRVLLRARPSGGTTTTFDDGRLRIDFGHRSISLDGAELTLSRKEWGLLTLLVRHAGRVVTQPQILRSLWGPDHLDDTHYLRILAGKLRSKLGDHAAEPHYVRTEPGIGLRFIGGCDISPQRHRDPPPFDQDAR
jgi:two-component system KDP operon response regulator KdpE